MTPKPELLFPILLLVIANLAHAQTKAEYRNDYELTVDVALRASAGWELYKQEKFAGSLAGGHFTDPDPETRGKEFWSDGVYAKFDRDNNSHGETIFFIDGEKLVYAGCVGGTGQWVHTSKSFFQHAEALTEFANAHVLLIVKPNPSAQTDKATIARAKVGWKLYQQKRFAGAYAGGHYTDPEPATRLKEFWSDGIIAKFSRDGSGTHESIFFVNKNAELEYVGRLGRQRKFDRVERKFRKFKSQSLSSFERAARKVRGL